MCFKTALRTAAAIAAIAITSSASAATEWQFDSKFYTAGLVLNGSFLSDGTDWQVAAGDIEYSSMFSPLNSTMVIDEDANYITWTSNSSHMTSTGAWVADNFATINFEGSLTQSNPISLSFSESHYHEDTGNTSGTYGIDYFMSPVPEPEVLAMSLVGLAAVAGAAARRRRVQLKQFA